MKHLSRFIALTFLPLSLLSLNSCAKNNYYSDAKQIAPFLHEITYNDYEYDSKYETLTVDDMTGLDFGCTAIRNGNLYGRNYDYYYSNSPSILVKMKSNNERYKSIGIANHFGLEDDDLVNLEKSRGAQHAINIIPNFMLDGINENGVVCNMNIVDTDDGGGKVLSTNPGKPKLYIFFALRYILDNAKSAEHAIQLLNEHDIYALEQNTNNVHFMIADANKTYIVEFITKNGLTKLRAEEKYSKERVMVNFYNNLTPQEAAATYKNTPAAYSPIKNYNNNAHGTERYEFIQDHYEDCETTYGMWSVLHDIRYGIMYLNPEEPDWPSEDFSQEEIYAVEEMGGEYKDYRDIYNLTRFILDSGRRDLGRVGDTWITMHSEIFDIEEKTMRLNVQEDYVNTYNYDLNF